MTETELKAIWVRYMHRNDLTADLDTTLELVQSRISERLMLSEIDVGAILEDNPRMFVHGGLCYLAELARDTEQMQLEEQYLAEAIRDYSFRQSIDRLPRPMASRPYFDGGNDAA